MGLGEVDLGRPTTNDDNRNLSNILFMPLKPSSTGAVLQRKRQNPEVLCFQSTSKPKPSNPPAIKPMSIFESPGKCVSEDGIDEFMLWIQPLLGRHSWFWWAVCPAKSRTNSNIRFYVKFYKGFTRVSLLFGEWWGRFKADSFQNPTIRKPSMSGTSSLFVARSVKKSDVLSWSFEAPKSRPLTQPPRFS